MRRHAVTPRSSGATMEHRRITACRCSPRLVAVNRRAESLTGADGRCRPRISGFPTLIRSHAGLAESDRHAGPASVAPVLLLEQGIALVLIRSQRAWLEDRARARVIDIPSRSMFHSRIQVLRRPDLQTGLQVMRPASATGSTQPRSLMHCAETELYFPNNFFLTSFHHVRRGAPSRE
jgi:hypothetical protein